MRNLRIISTGHIVAISLVVAICGASVILTNQWPKAQAQASSISPAQGPPGITAVGAPNARTLSLSTAYQATTPTKPAQVVVNISSVASISLSGGTTNSANVIIGPSSSVDSGTGTIICSYANSNTGTLTVGLGLSTISAVPCSFALPIGWFWAIRQTSGAVSITSAADQSIG